VRHSCAGEFDARRRSAERHAELEAMYGDQPATPETAPVIPIDVRRKVD
jgi:hypothetical protein